MASSSEQSPSTTPITEESSDYGKKSLLESSETCRVCGDGHARMHYGVLTCFGCKGFFRRTLKRSTEYSCKHNGNCIVDRHERNSCRYCRFKRCLEVGMDPKAVRPDRDATGRHYQVRVRRTKIGVDYESYDEVPVGDDWCRKLPVDMRTTLMQLMNIELIVNKGDTQKNAKEIYPLPFKSLREILDDPSLLDGSRTEMRYEPYRKVAKDELLAIAHRRLIAIIDWVDNLSDLMDLQSTEDKLILVKSGFAPLTIFAFCASTAKCTRDRDIMCLCNFGCVPRNIHRLFDEPYHLSNRIIDRSLDELVEPFRMMHLNDEEIVLLKAIIVLNPYLKHLSKEASEQIAELRDRIQETLYHVVRETHPKEAASSRFGNLLLFTPTIMILGNVMYENLQFVQSFGKRSIDPLLCELLDNIEPLDDAIINFSDDPSDLPIRPSTSSSSVSSLVSQDSFSSCTASEDNMHDSEAELEHSLLIPQQSFTQLNNGGCESSNLTNACSLPNLDQVESDPDYNVTLTADMFTGMRQAISAAQNMDLDVSDTPPNSPHFGYTPITTPRPHFFLEDGARTTTTERFGNRHKFTVTARRFSVDQQNLSYIRTDGESASSEPSNFQLSNRSASVYVVDQPLSTTNAASMDLGINDSPQSSSCGSYPETSAPIMKNLYSNTVSPTPYMSTPVITNAPTNENHTVKPGILSSILDDDNLINPNNIITDSELIHDPVNQSGYDAMDYY